MSIISCYTFISLQTTVPVNSTGEQLRWRQESRGVNRREEHYSLAAARTDYKSPQII